MEIFEDHLKLNVSFRIHRLHLMQYRQHKDENMDDFVTRVRTLALKCNFTEAELSERLLELIIASTPYEGFRNDLGQEKGHSLMTAVETGRKYEALSAGGKQINDLSQSQGNITYVDTLRLFKCPNCGLKHKPKVCPAFGDVCRSCGKVNHWAKVCGSKGHGETSSHKKAPQHKSDHLKPSRIQRHANRKAQQTRKHFAVLTDHAAASNDSAEEY